MLVVKVTTGVDQARMSVGVLRGEQLHEYHDKTNEDDTKDSNSPFR